MKSQQPKIAVPTCEFEPLPAPVLVFRKGSVPRGTETVPCECSFCGAACMGNSLALARRALRPLCCWTCSRQAETLYYAHKLKAEPPAAPPAAETQAKKGAAS